ncbi:MAG: ATP12 family protein [Pseudomonadota bacterium]
MKRFYKIAAAEPAADGWTVTLDGRPIRTPAKAAFIAPNEGTAAAAATEWMVQEDVVKPAEMPITRSVNTAIDRTGPEFDQVAEMVAAYGGSDLLCYRAVGPEALTARQAAAWEPLLAWAETTFGSRLVATTGVMHVEQPAGSLTRLTEAVRGFDPYALTALYDLVALSGSLIIGLGVAEGRLNAATGWQVSRIDETWQEEMWGVDADAAALAARKAGEFAAAARFIDLLRGSS